MALSQQIKLLGLYTLGLAGMRGQDVILASFPRSGSTWVRFLLANLIHTCEAIDRQVDFSLLNNMMPALGANNLLKAWPHHALPRVVKTHRPYSSLFGRRRAIGLIRDPRDVMVSFYHFQKDRKGRAVTTFSEFIRDRTQGLESWCTHYTSWRQHWALVVTYEALKADTFGEFNRILQVLGVSYPDEIVQTVISRTTLESTRAAESSSASAIKPEARFARSGQTKQWPAYFASEDLAYYAELTRRYALDVYTE